MSWLKNLVRSWSSRCRPVPFRPARSRRLVLEQLEDRLAPATLATSSLLVDPSAGRDSDMVVTAGAWTATSNAPWLHTSSTGNGNGLATFTFDANTGGTRSGTLTIAGQSLTVTQAGSSYVAANSVKTLAATGQGYPIGVAADAAGNVYFGNAYGDAIMKWQAATQKAVPLVTGLQNPMYVALALDAAGNVYFSDSAHSAVKVWQVATRKVVLLADDRPSGFEFHPTGVAVDAARNVYIADTYNNAIKMIVRAYVPGRAVSEGATAGSDALQVVLPSAQSLTGLFAPKSDQNWLTIGPIANGVIRFAFTANPGPTRTAHITVLGQKITVTQVGLVTSLIRRIPVGMFPGVPNSLRNLTRVLGGWNA